MNPDTPRYLFWRDYAWRVWWFHQRTNRHAPSLGFTHPPPAMHERAIRKWKYYQELYRVAGKRSSRDDPLCW